jgi:hypothetical protein
VTKITPSPSKNRQEVGIMGDAVKKWHEGEMRMPSTFDQPPEHVDRSLELPTAENNAELLANHLPD